MSSHNDKELHVGLPGAVKVEDVAALGTLLPESSVTGLSPQSVTAGLSEASGTPQSATTATKGVNNDSLPRTHTTRSGSASPATVPLVIADPQLGPTSDIQLSEYELLNDPMRNLTEKLSTWNKVKYYGYGIVAVPVKTLSVVGVLLIGNVLGSISQIGLKKPKKNSDERIKPLKGWRRFFAGGIHFFCRVMLLNFGFYYIKVSGKKDPKATVLVSNHMGPFEATALLYFSGATVVSRIENAHIPLLGPILRSIQCIFVNRNSVQSRDDTVSQIDERAKAKPGVWPPLLIFPEGTTGNGKSIMRFRVGAFQPGVPVQPVVAKFHWKHLDPTWSSEKIGMGDLILRVMTQFTNTLELQYLPTYYPSEEEKKDPHLYAENVRKYMSSKSGVPLSKYSLDDFFVLAEAHKYNIPHSEAMLGMEMLRKDSNVTAQDVKNIMKAFHEIDNSKSGKIRYGPFLRSLGMPDTPVTRNIFAEVMSSAAAENEGSPSASFASSEPGSTVEKGASSNQTSPSIKSSPSVLDTDFSVSTSDNPNAKGISFRNFLRAIIRINKKMSTDDKITQAFNIVNFTGSGKISKEELMAIFEFASEQISPAQVKDIYAKMDTRHVGYIDRVEFGAFMRANPIYLAMFEASRRFERLKDDNNPVVQALEAREKGTPYTATQFRELVHEYRTAQLIGSQSAMSF